MGMGGGRKGGEEGEVGGGGGVFGKKVSLVEGKASLFKGAKHWREGEQKGGRKGEHFRGGGGEGGGGRREVNNTVGKNKVWKSRGLSQAHCSASTGEDEVGMKRAGLGDLTPAV